MQKTKEKNKKHSEIKILYANARGIRSKINSLTAATLLYQPELIIITESHIVGKTNITIKGYREKILRNRKSKGGGILIAKKLAPI